MNNDISFPLFVTLWNHIQGMTTPDIHMKITAWLWHRYQKQDSRLLLMAFRACGKSTLVSLYAAWRLMQNPDLRILVLSADETLAVRMVRHVRRVIERHPLTSGLLQKAPDQWAMDRFTVARSAELSDPSMTARGLMGNLTGLRADLIICDDVEVPNTSDTSEKRDELRARLHELNYIAAPGAHILYVGTPHTFDTIYEAHPRADIAGHTPFLHGYKTLKIPVMDTEGNSVWPEKFPGQNLIHLRKMTSPARFESQMMLQPMRVNESVLNIADLQIYDHALTPVKELGHLYIGDAQMVSCSAWWDPALGTKKGDGSALAVVFTGSNGHIWLHHLSYIKVDESVIEDAATYQCARVAEVMKALHVPAIGVEINGIGRFLPAILRREMVRARAGAVVIEQSARIAKNERIIEAFAAPMAARMIHVHADIMRTRFADEMRDFSPSSSSRHDDGLDAAAGAILMEPMRMQATLCLSARPFWRQGTTFFVKNET